MLARSVLALLLIAVGAGVPAMAAQLTFDLKVEHGRVAENMRLIRVKQGDIVTLRWTSDQPLVLHLHGPAIEMTFTAYATGRFSIHVHAQGAGGRAHEATPLVNVEVYPR